MNGIIAFADFAITMVGFQILHHWLPTWFNVIYLGSVLAVILITIFYPPAGIVLFLILASIVLLLFAGIVFVNFWPYILGAFLAVMLVVALFFSIASWGMLT